MLVLVGVLLSLGAINAMIPILIILILLVASAGLNRGYSLFNFFGISTLAGINPGGKASVAGKTGFNFAAYIIGPPVGGTLKLGSRAVAGAKKLMGRALMSRTGSRSIMSDIKKAGKATNASQTGLATKWPRATKPQGTKAQQRVRNVWKYAKPIGAGLLYKPLKSTKSTISNLREERRLSGARPNRAFRLANALYLRSRQRIAKPKNILKSKIVGSRTASAFAKTKLGQFTKIKLAPLVVGNTQRSGRNRRAIKSFAGDLGVVAFPGITVIRSVGRNTAKAIDTRRLATGRGPPTEEQQKTRRKTIDALGQARETAVRRVAELGGFENMTPKQRREVKREARRTIAKGYKEDTASQRTLVGSAIRNIINGSAYAAAKELAAAINRGRSTEGTTGTREARDLLLHKLASTKGETTQQKTTPQSINYAREVAATVAAFVDSNSRRKAGSRVERIRKSTIHSENLANVAERTWAETVANSNLQLREILAKRTRNPKILQAQLKSINNDIERTGDAIRNRIASQSEAETVSQVGKRAGLAHGVDYDQGHINRLNNLKASVMASKIVPENVLKDAAFGREPSGVESSPLVRAAAIASERAHFSKEEIDELSQREIKNANDAAERMSAAKSKYEETSSRYAKVIEESNRSDSSEKAQEAAKARVEEAMKDQTAAEDSFIAAMKNLNTALIPLNSIAKHKENGSKTDPEVLTNILTSIEKTASEYKSSLETLKVTDPEEYKKLSVKEDEFGADVKVAIAKNPATRDEVLAHLLENKNKEVHKAADNEILKRTKKRTKSKTTSTIGQEDETEKQAEVSETGSDEEEGE